MSIDPTPRAKIAPVVADVLDGLADVDRLAGWYVNRWHGYDWTAEDGMRVRMYAVDLASDELRVVVFDASQVAMSETTFEVPPVGQWRDVFVGLVVDYVDQLLGAVDQ